MSYWTIQSKLIHSPFIWVAVIVVVVMVMSFYFNCFVLNDTFQFTHFPIKFKALRHQRLFFLTFFGSVLIRSTHFTQTKKLTSDLQHWYKFGTAYIWIGVNSLFFAALSYAIHTKPMGCCWWLCVHKNLYVSVFANGT